MTRQRQLELQSALEAQRTASSAQRGTSSKRVRVQRALLSASGVLGMVGLLALSGCPADLANPSRFDQAAGANSGAAGGATVDTSCLSDAFTVCVTCHKSGAAPALGAGLDLQSDGVAARLVNVAATHLDTTGTCPSAKLVDTTNPAASWLLIKVNGKQGDCGGVMPLIGNPLSASQLACLQKFATDEAAAVNGVSAGASGATGAAGSSGATGVSGAVGSSGTTGASGAVGSSGTTGASGAVGSSGTTASAGSSASGVSGSAGTSGSNAAGGSSGSNGSAGTAGTSGANASGTGGT